MRNKQEKQFPSQADAIRFIMILDPHFRTQIEDHDDALGG